MRHKRMPRIWSMWRFSVVAWHFLLSLPPPSTVSSIALLVFRAALPFLLPSHHSLYAAVFLSYFLCLLVSPVSTVKKNVLKNFCSSSPDATFLALALPSKIYPLRCMVPPAHHSSVRWTFLVQDSSFQIKISESLQIFSPNHLSPLLSDLLPFSFLYHTSHHCSHNLLTT